MFWLPNQGLHSLRVFHCSRLKVWYGHIAKFLRAHPFSCRLEIPPRLFKTAGEHLQTLQCPFHNFFDGVCGFFEFCLVYLFVSYMLMQQRVLVLQGQGRVHVCVGKGSALQVKSVSESPWTSVS